MAFTQRSSVSKPVALPYLVREGILPANAHSDEYSWQTYTGDTEGNAPEEVTYTSKCVVWAQGQFVRRVFKFSHDGDRVQHAFLTWFLNHNANPPRNTKLLLSARTRERALVVIMDRRSHIFFSSGSSHVVNLPFDIDRAFPTPRGVLLQRQITTTRFQAPTPLLPHAPPNSFRSSQGQAWFTQHSSRPRQAAPPRPSLSSPFSDLDIFPVAAPSDDLPRLFTLTDPLLELGLVADAAGEPSNPSGMGYASERTVTGLARSEEVVYISPHDEFLTGPSERLLLMLTVDRMKRVYRLWQAIYLEAPPFAARASAKKVTSTPKIRKAKRNSSNPRDSTGSTTPIPNVPKVRPKRESGINRASLLGLQDLESDDNDTGNFTNFDGDFGAAADTEKKSNRRTSSMMARAELSSQEQSTFTEFARGQSGTHGSFRAKGGPGASFGAAGDRGSFGRSRTSLRASTSGSIFRLSDVDELGSANSTAAENDTLIDFLTLEDDPGAHSVITDGLKKDMIVSHVASIPFCEEFKPSQYSLPEPEARLSAFTASGEWSRTPAHARQRTINLHLIYPTSKVLAEIECRVTESSHPTASPSSSRGRNAETYLRCALQDVRVHGQANILDARVIRDGPISRLLEVSEPSNGDLQISYDAFPTFGTQQATRFSRICQLDRTSVRLRSGERLLDTVKFRLHPLDDSLNLAIDLCHSALDQAVHNMPSIRSVWMTRRQRLGIKGSLNDWIAFYEVILTVVMVALNTSELPMRSITMPSAMARGPAGIWSVRSWAWAAGESQSSTSAPDESTIAPIIKRCMAEVSSNDNLVKALRLSCLAADSDRTKPDRSLQICFSIVAALHLWCEEQHLDVLSESQRTSETREILASICYWIGWQSAESHFLSEPTLQPALLESGELSPSYAPRSLQDFVDVCLGTGRKEKYALFEGISEAQKHSTREADDYLDLLLQTLSPLCPRTNAVVAFCRSGRPGLKTGAVVEALSEHSLNFDILETLPEGIAAHLRSRLKLFQRDLPTALHSASLRIIDRPDVGMLVQSTPATAEALAPTEISRDERHAAAVLEDMRHQLDSTSKTTSTARLLKDAASPTMRLVYRDDKRWQEAAKILNPLRVAVTTIFPKKDSTEAQFLEDQKALAELVYKRTMAIPSGQAALHFNTHKPLLTEKIEIKPFNTTCSMQPSNNVVNADKSNFTEEKVSWAFFHAGVNAGLRIAKDSSKVDTSWLVLNKPTELGNRHAGLLFALGLNGHLKTMAKWLAFKYLTPKHSMTSIGLLLGLSASHMGTMDSLVTRLLSVHVVRLLPPGAAELNLSPLTQTAGVLGIGLLYYGTQHRRMSEVMLSEIENLSAEDTPDSPDAFRDECYRVSAGFSLGLINLGKGRNLRSLHDMNLPERLLAIATGSRSIDMVHILDQAVPGAVMAFAMIFMKSHNERLAAEIGVPSSTQQFDYVRPDMLLLRTVASNLIMWDNIEPSFAWIHHKLPRELQGKSIADVFDILGSVKCLDSSRLPLYNILAGLCWSIGLKCAGGAPGSPHALEILIKIFDLIRHVLDESASLLLTYDELLAKDTMLRFQHVLALSMATVAAGSGNLEVFRRLRYLHANIHAEETFGLHQATHQAMGVLFLGQGRYTFSTSDLSIASLLCAFYPLFPKHVLDNRAHLQALRHLWVYAADARCLMPRDIETKEVVTIPVMVRLRTGEEQQLVAPALLPEFDTIAEICTAAPDYWTVTLDFARQPHHLAAFRRHQTIFLRRKGLLDQHDTLLGASVSSLSARLALPAFAWVFALPGVAAAGIDASCAASLLPTMDPALTLLVRDTTPIVVRALLHQRTTALDDVLGLAGDVWSDNVARLVALRSLLQLAAGAQAWMRPEWIEALQRAVGERFATVRRSVQGEAVDTQMANA